MEAKSNKNWLIMGVLAFFVQGSWTLWVNFAHGWDKALPPALMQGLLSGASASVMTLMMEWIYRTVAQAALRFILSIIMPSLFMAAVLYALHRAIGTPEIAATMTLPMIAIIAYAVIYTLKLRKAT